MLSGLGMGVLIGRHNSTCVRTPCQWQGRTKPPRSEPSCTQCTMSFFCYRKGGSES